MKKPLVFGDDECIQLKYSALVIKTKKANEHYCNCDYCGKSGHECPYCDEIVTTYRQSNDPEHLKFLKNYH